jgi:hypothetical protein
MLATSTNRQPQTILWIALVVLALAALGNHMTLKTCVGECCAVEAMSCCEDELSVPAGTAKESCCSRCGTHNDAADETPRGDEPDFATGACAPGCCITVAFDVDMAPIAAPVQLPTLATHAPAPALPACLPTPARQAVRERPFDRGPPRIDRRTALRAYVVLLI